MTDATSDAQPEQSRPRQRRKDDRPHRSRGLTAFAASLLFLISLVATNEHPWGVIFWIGTGILATWIWIAAWDEPAKKWWRRAGAVVTLTGWVLGVFFVMNHPVEPMRLKVETRHRFHCAMNLRQIGQAMLLWSNEHDGRYPDRIEQLLDVEGTTAEIFVCPAVGDPPATGPTTRDVADQLTSGGHLSYVYLGKGLTRSADGEVVLVYERPGNHAGEFGGGGVHMLTGDGNVKWVHELEAERLIAELKAGHNPPKRKR